MAQNFFKKGSWNRISDRSGFKVKADRTRKEWTNAIVMDREWEPRNAQEFVRGIPDMQAAPDPRPEAADTFQNAQFSNGYLVVEDTGIIQPITTETNINIQIYSPTSTTGTMT